MSRKPYEPQMGTPTQPVAAVVMNMFYTGLGIARTLGARGVPVIGLSAKRGVYGNYTRYATVRLAPDSREAPDRLLDYLLAMGAGLAGKGVLFPTRDDDLVFLDRFRTQLERYYIPLVPSKSALNACLDKWETSRSASRAGVPAPRCWKIDCQEDLTAILVGDITFPCVLKPLSAHHWRQGRNWERVGARKAVRVSGPAELQEEYDLVARSERRALLQELVPGGDEQLFIAACYLDRESRPVASFTAQKLIQAPEGFGTGCVVQTAKRAGIVDDAFRLLQEIKFSGVAEVEFKWDSAKGQHMLIEVNPRPWDQHTLGQACGSDLIYIAYCHAAGLPVEAVASAGATCKWIAEDVFLGNAMRSLWKGDGGKIRTLWISARGRRIYGVWHPRDPLPFIACMVVTLSLLAMALLRRVGSWLWRRNANERFLKETHAQ